MTMIVGQELRDLIAKGMIENVREGAVEESTVDVHLSDTVLIENVWDNPHKYVEYGGGAVLKPAMVEKKLNPYITLYPGNVVLASTLEVFNLPKDVSAKYTTKSTMGRIFLEHLSSDLCKPGWSGSTLTLELVNLMQYHCLRLYAGAAIGQMTFFRHSEVETAYAGRYNNDLGVTEVKG